MEGTHTQTHTLSHTTSLVFPGSACELYTPNYSQEKSSKRSINASHCGSSTPGTVRHIRPYKKHQETKQKKTISTLKLYIPALFKLNTGRTEGDCELLPSSRNSQGRAKLCCQIQQLNSVHDDADWRKCLSFLCKHQGCFKKVFSHRWSGKTTSVQAGLFPVS